MKRAVAALIGFLALTLGACAQKPALTPQSAMCDFRTIPLDIPVPGQSNAEDPMRVELENSLRAYPSRMPNSTKPPMMLSFSGGSEHGAYGAGILAGWGGTGDLPDFQVVTGVSTGSILSTFAFVNEPAKAVAGYTINSESELADVYAKPKDGKPDLANFETLVKYGSFANLDPLKERLGQFITDDVLLLVATKHNGGARLLIGATDLDSGRPVAFDLGDMATRYIASQVSGDGKEGQWKSCYIAAILASSSAPMAAPPVFIDNTMYVDGGMRFGMFGDPTALVQMAHWRGEAPDLKIEDDIYVPAPITYAIIDGTLDLPAPSCPKADASLCTKDNPMGGKEGVHKDWNIMSLAMASERVLVNQVYRFSALQLEDDACEESGCFNFLRIEDDVADFDFTYLDPAKSAPETLTCNQWQQIDIETDDPIEFQKRYMRCLISYGKAKVGEAGWGS